MRLIDADALLSDIEHTIEESGCVNHEREIIECVEYAPTIEPVTGKWVESNPNNNERCFRVECSNCGRTIIVNSKLPLSLWAENKNYCEKCGAKMEGDKPADKLLPCIKCNSRPSRRVYADREYYYEVVCVPCKIVASGETQEAADRAWNKLNEGDKA